MSELLNLVMRVLDPRGRCDRRGLLILMLATLLLQSLLGVMIFGLGLSYTGPFAVAIKLVFVYVAISSVIQRLHDTGRSGWMLLAAFVGVLVWFVIWGGAVPLGVALTYGPQHVGLFSPLFFILNAVACLPVVAGALWLHFKRGEPVANRFGPVPGPSGFAARHAAETPASPNGAPVAA